MYKNGKDGLLHISDDSRIKFRTNISKSLLESLKSLAEEHNTHVNYLLENGLRNCLNQNIITFNKELRPNDRVQYKTTYDKELLEQVKEFAKQHKLYINDVIEYSTTFIEIDNIKNRAYRYRIE
jgi:hypothetical protein